MSLLPLAQPCLTQQLLRCCQLLELGTTLPAWSFSCISATTQACLSAHPCYTHIPPGLFNPALTRTPASPFSLLNWDPPVGEGHSQPPLISQGLLR